MHLEENIAHEVTHASVEVKVPESYETSMSYVHMRKLLDLGSTDIDDVHAYSMECNIIMNFNPQPQSVEECRHKNDWTK